MQPLVTITQHNIALLFCNYLKTKKISSEVQTIEKNFVILVATNKMEAARQLFDEFIKDPFDKKYQQAAWQQGEVTHVIHDNAHLGQNFLDHAGVVTLSIFSLCWLIFLLSIFGWGNDIFQQLQFFPQLNLSTLFHQPWRLIGPALFHFSWLHITFDTMWWWQLGGDVEKKLGKGTLFNVFIITAIASNLGQYLVSGANFGGLSGVVYGLVGFMWWLGWLAPEKEVSLTKPLVVILLLWMLLGFAEILPINMANTAHLMGLLSGCFMAFFYAKVKR